MPKSNVVFIGEVFFTYEAIFDDAVMVELVGWLMNSAKLGAILGPDLCSAVLSQRPLASGSGPDLWSSLAQYRGKGKVSETGVKQTSRWVMVILVLCHRYPRGPSLSGDQFMTPTFEKRHQNLFVLFDWCWR